MLTLPLLPLKRFPFIVRLSPRPIHTAASTFNYGENGHGTVSAMIITYSIVDVVLSPGEEAAMKPRFAMLLSRSAGAVQATAADTHCCESRDGGERAHPAC